MENPRLPPRPGTWQRRLRRELGWALLGKLAALVLLWALFFSPSHRQRVDDSLAGGRLGVEPVPAATSTPP